MRTKLKKTPTIDELYERAEVEDSLRVTGYCEAARRWLLNVMNKPSGCMDCGNGGWWQRCDNCAYNSHKVPSERTVSIYLGRVIGA